MYGLAKPNDKLCHLLNRRSIQMPQLLNLKRLTILILPFLEATGATEWSLVTNLEKNGVKVICAISRTECEAEAHDITESNGTRTESVTIFVLVIIHFFIIPNQRDWAVTVHFSTHGV